MRYFISFLLLFFSCTAADWPVFQQNTSHTGIWSQYVPAVTGEKLSFQTDAGCVSSPVHINGKILFGSRDGFFYCLNSNGTLAWKYDAKAWIDCTAACEGEYVYFGNTTGKFFSLKIADGTEMFSVTLSGAIISSPVFDSSAVYVATSYPDSALYALNKTTGAQLWKKSFDSMVLSSPAVDSGKLVIADNHGKLFIINTSTGAELFTPVETNTAYNLSSPLIASGYAWFVTQETGKKLYRLNLTDGTSTSASIESSSYIFSHSSSPCSDGGYIYFMFGHPQTTLYAFNMSSMSKVWSQTIGETLHTGKLASPVISGSAVIAIANNADNTSTVYSYNKSNGALNWSYNLADTILSSPAIIDDMLIVTGNSGKCYLLSDDATAVFTLSRASHENGAQRSTLLPVFSLYFTAAIDSSTAAASVYFLDSSYSKINGTISVSGTKISIIPSSALLSNAQYMLMIKDSLRSAQGVAFDGDRNGTAGGDYSISFSTASYASPAITAFVPDRDSEDIELNTKIQWTLSNTVSDTHIEDYFQIRRGSVSGSPVSGMYHVVSADTVEFIPEYPLAYNSTYAVSITGLKDINGISFPDYSYSFSTKGSTTLKYIVHYNQGINIVAPPVLISEDLRAKDLLNLLGASYIIGYDTINSRTVICFPNSSEEKNYPVICGYAYIMHLPAEKDITWEGFLPADSFSYPSGMIMAGLPGNYNENYTAQQFCELFGVSSCIHFNYKTQKFEYSSPSNNFQLEIGHGCILTTKRPVTITLTGGEFSVSTSVTATAPAGELPVISVSKHSQSETVQNNYSVNLSISCPPVILSSSDISAVNSQYFRTDDTSETAIFELLRSNLYNVYIIDGFSQYIEDLSFYKELREKINAGAILICSGRFKTNEIFDFAIQSDNVAISSGALTTDPTYIASYAGSKTTVIKNISQGNGKTISRLGGYPLLYMNTFGNGAYFYFSAPLSSFTASEQALFIESILERFAVKEFYPPYSPSSVFSVETTVTNNSSATQNIRLRMASLSDYYFITASPLHTSKWLQQEFTLSSGDSKTLQFFYKIPYSPAKSLIDAEIFEQQNGIYTYVQTERDYRDSIVESKNLSDRLTEEIYNLNLNGFSTEAQALEEVLLATQFQSKTEIEENLNKIIVITDNIKNEPTLRRNMQRILDVYESELFWWGE